LAKEKQASEHSPTSEKSTAAQNELQVLIRDCIAMSRSAQRRLYDLYAPDAYGIIKRYICNNEPVAKEILNDAFFKIFRDIGQYSFQGAFEGWVRRIVLHTITDNLRKGGKDRERIQEVQEEDAYINAGAIEQMSQKELLKLIDTLPAAQREVFNMFVFDNLSHKEIAQLLNINENNCRWHLNDARRRLKEKINSIIK
jgi:RNA polymerase sigma factor (sigma-70 family)